MGLFLQTKTKSIVNKIIVNKIISEEQTYFVTKYSHYYWRIGEVFAEVCPRSETGCSSFLVYLFLHLL